MLKFVFIACAVGLFFFSFKQSIDYRDFSAFDCAGQAVRLHIDPDQADALHACEQHVLAQLQIVRLPEIVVPAPFPAYALAFFSLLSYLPVATACGVWVSLQCGSIIGTWYLLAKLTRLPLPLILATTVMMLAYWPLRTGEVTPIVFFCYVGMLWALESNALALGVLAALCTLLEPHLGLAVCLGLFVLEARTRLLLIAGGVLLASVSLLAMPFDQVMQYVRVILPAHAASEITRDTQFSLTHLLVLAGISKSLALKCASLQYIAMLIGGTIAALQLQRRKIGRSLCLSCIPACAVIGGTFMHVGQLLMINITALLLIGYQKDSSIHLRSKAISISPLLIILAFPLMKLQSSSEALLFACIAAIIVLYSDTYTPIGVGIIAFLTEGIAAWALVLMIRISAAKQLTLQQLRSLLLNAMRLTNSAESLWATFVSAQLSPLRAWSLLFQAPTILAALWLIYRLFTIDICTDVAKSEPI